MVIHVSLRFHKGFVLSLDAILSLMILLGFSSFIVVEEINLNEELKFQEQIDLEIICFKLNKDCSYLLEKTFINDEDIIALT